MDKLKIENLDLYYEKFHALKDINLSICLLYTSDAADE